MTDTTDIKALREACEILNDHGYLTKSGKIRSSNLAEAVRMIIEQSVSYAEQLEAERQRAELFKFAFDEWFEKTDWVQDRKKFPFQHLGMHRADVMATLIEHLEADNAALKEAFTPVAGKYGAEMVTESRFNKACSDARAWRDRALAAESRISHDITCYSCKKVLTITQHAEADGFCPHCNVEIELDEDELLTAPQKPVVLPHGYKPYLVRSQTTATRAAMTSGGEWLHRDEVTAAIEAAGGKVAK